MLQNVYKRYASFFEEIGVLEEFQKLLDEVDEAMDKEFIDRIITVSNLYERLETFCRKCGRHRHRKLPPTILNNFKADVIDVIETIPLLTP